MSVENKATGDKKFSESLVLNIKKRYIHPGSEIVLSGRQCD